MKKDFNRSTTTTSSIKLNLVLLTAILGLTTSPLMAQRGGRGATPPTASAAAAPGRMVNKEDSAYIRKNYKKMEVMIPMRDGVKLYTCIYVPKDDTKSYPIMLDRTPYGCAPYGPDAYKASLSGHPCCLPERGLFLPTRMCAASYMSEGDFVATRPYIANKKTKNDIDESSDTYDAIDWMIKNLPNNNGKVGVWGISAPGFYATSAAIDAHPALKAVSPQAPVTNWFMGDDRHHNGVFQEMGTFCVPIIIWSGAANAYP
jgi:predicted acyl esterase